MGRTAVVRNYMYCAAVSLLVTIGVELLFLPVVDCFPPRPTDPAATTAACSDPQPTNLVVVASSSQEPAYHRRTSLFPSLQQRQPRRFGSLITTAAFAVKSNNSNNNSNSSKNNPEQLHFVSEIHVVSSEPLPTTDRSQVDAFFESTTCRNHFLSGGGTNAIRDEPRTPELETCWRRACESHYGSQYLPTPDDPIVSTETLIQFPGLRLVNCVYSGVKLVDETKGSPASCGTKEYHTLLIAEQRHATGPAPLVWLYNQLTGGESKRIKQQQQPSNTDGPLSNGELDSSSNSSNSRTGEASGYAVSRIYITEELPPQDDSDGAASGGEYYYKIGFECTVEVMVQFPRFLLKILPVSKEKMEQQGSLSVKKAVEKGILKAMESTTQAFEEWKATTSAATPV